MKFTKNALMGSSSLTRPLLLLGTASALMGAGPAYALGVNALPQGGTVTGGSATISQSGTNTLNINQSSNRAIIDWRSFNVGSQATTNFAQPNSSSIAVNRVNASTNPSQIEGTINANGQVWILNPNGVFFGKTATVNAAGIVASTANIQDSQFMSGSNTLNMTGGDSGKVVNEGNITVGEGGLAAFVAPSVRNSGTINATVGKVALAAGDSYTLDLAGDHLVEIATGATNAVVTQSGKVVNPGGTIEISAAAASAVVDSVINMSGVTTASSATSSGGQIVLGADDINVASTAQTSADGGGTGNGGNITMVANKTGNYAGSLSAQGGAQGGDGGNIETSGETVNLDPNISINASAPAGIAGTWTLDPQNIVIDSAEATTIQNTLASSNVTLNAGTGGGTQQGNITMQGTAISATNTTHNLTLKGSDLSTDSANDTINIGGALTLDVNQVNNTGATVSASFITDALGMIGNVGGGTTVNLGAGTYTGAVLLSQSNVTLAGAGVGSTFIDSTASGLTYGIQVTGSGDTLSKFSVNSPTGGDGIVVAPTANGAFNISNVAITVTGSGHNGLDLTGVEDLNAGTAINNVVVTGDGGFGIAVTDSDSITISNTTTSGDSYGVALIEDGNSPVVEGNISISNVATNNSFESATLNGPSGFTGVFAEDTSATQAFGSIIVTGDNAIAADADSPGIVFTDTQADAETILGNLSDLPTGYVEGWSNSGAGKGFGNNTFYVDVVGATPMSINAAVTAATAGGTINFDTVNTAANAYTGQAVDISKQLTLNLGTGIGSTAGSGITGLASFTLDPGAKGSILSGNISAGTIALNGAVTLDTNVTLDTSTGGAGNTGGSLTVAQVDGKTAGGQALALTAGAGTVSLGDVGDAIRLGDVNDIGATLDAATILTGTSYKANSFALGDVTLGNTVTINTSVNGAGSGDVQMASVDGTAANTQGLTIIAGTGNTIWLGDVGSATRLAAFSATGGTSTLTGNTYKADSITFGNLILTQAGTTLDASTGNLITGKIDGASIALNVDAGGTISLGDIGDGGALGAVIETNAGTEVNPAAVTLAGSSYTAASFDFGDDVALGVTGTTITSSNGAITIGALDGTSSTAHSLTISATGGTVSLGDVGDNASFAVGAVTDNNTTSLTGSNYDASSFKFGNLSLSQDALITASTGSITAGTVDGSGAGGQTLELVAASGTVTLGDIGDSTPSPMGRVTDDNTSILTGTNYAADSFDFGDLTLDQNTLITTTGVKGTSIRSVEGSGASGGQTLTLADGPVTLGNAGNTKALGAVSDNNATTLTGTAYKAASFAFGNLTLDSSATITATGTSGITAGTVDAEAGQAGNESLTLVSANGTASLGNVGGTTALGAVTDTSAGGVALAGSSYKAASFDLGATTLSSDTVIDTSQADNAGLTSDGPITLGTVDNATGTNSLTLITGTAGASLGSVGQNTTALDAVTDTSSGGVTLTGKNYTASSFDLGAVTLGAANGSTTAITATGANGITIVSLGGAAPDKQNLTLSATTGPVSLGDIGDNSTALGTVIDTSNTTLTGSSYEASKFDFGGLVLYPTGAQSGDLATTTVITADGTGSNIITIASVDGQYNDQENLTLNAANGTVSLGAVDAPALPVAVDMLGAVVDTNNNGTTLTGTNYGAASFKFGNVTLDPTGSANLVPTITTITADTGNIAIGTVAGTFNDDQNLTLDFNTLTGTASINSVGATGKALGALISDNATTLSGTSYRAASFDLGTTTLNATGSDTTYINSKSDNGQITISSIDAGAAGENLTIVSGTAVASVGDIGDAGGALGAVTDTSANGIALTGSKYLATSVDFGNTTIDQDTTIDTSATDTLAAADGTITLGTVDNAATTGPNNLTLTSGTAVASVGSIGGAGALGAVSADGIALTGGNYLATSVDFGNTTIDQATTIDTSATDTLAAADGTITLGTVDNAATTGPNDLTLTSGTAVASVGSIGGAGALGAVSADGIALTGGNYLATSVDFGNTTIDQATTIDTSATDTLAAADGTITLGTVDNAATTGPNDLTLTSGTAVASVGSIGGAGALGAVSADGIALTGGNYLATSVDFGNTTIDQATTIDTSATDTLAATDGTITLGTVDNAATTGPNSLTLTSGGAVASVGDIGGGGALGAVSADGIALTGGNYLATSVDFGNTTIDQATTIDTSATDTLAATDGTITLGTVDNAATTGPNSLTLTSGGAVASVGDIGGGGALGAVSADGIALTGGNYLATSVDFGNTTIDQATTIDTSATDTLAAADGTITLGTVDNAATTGPNNLTLTSGTAVASVGSIGGAGALGAVSADGIALTGGNYLATSVDFGNTTIDQATTIDTSATDTLAAADGTITLGTVDNAATTGPNDLTLTSGTAVASVGSIGGAGALGAVSADGIALTGGNYLATSVDFGNTTIDQATTIDTSATDTLAAADGTITLGTVDNAATTGPNDLTLTSGTAVASVGSIGGAGALGAVSADGIALTGGNYLATSVDFGNTTIDQATTIDTSATDTLAATDGTITLGTVDNAATTGPNSLTLTSGGAVASVGDIGGGGALGAVSADGIALTGGNYLATSVDFGNTTIDQATTIDTSATDTLAAADGTITLGTVDNAATTGPNNLTLTSGGAVASIGDVGDAGALGDVTDNGAATTLNGSQYTAASFTLGDVTLKGTTSITSSDSTGISLGTVDGSGDKLTLTANNNGPVSLGNVGGAGALGDVNDNGAATTLNGTSYKAASFTLGDVTLTGPTAITSSDSTGISLGTVDGAGDTLSLTANNRGPVSLGDVGDAGALGDVNDNGAATTLNGTSYKAASFELGATTLATTNAAHLTTINASNGGITLASVDGNSGTNAQSLTLTATGTVSLGDIGDTTADKVGDVNDNSVNLSQVTTLAGSKYKAASFELGATTLTSSRDSTTMTATGDITLASVNGNSNRNSQALNLTAGSVSLGDVGDNTTDKVGDVNDNHSATTLTGSQYTASSFELGATTLTDANTTITSNSFFGGNITLDSVDGSGAGGQNLSLTDSNGTVSLGDVGDATATVGDVNDNGADTTLTGTSYKAGSFELGGTTLTNSAHLTTIGANSITLASVDGNSRNTAEALTLNANTVSLGSVGNGSSNLVGAVIDDQANNTTTLTGTVYKALSFLFGNLLLGNNSNIAVTATGGNITAGTVEGTRTGQNLTLSASGTVSVNNIGDTGSSLGTVTDTSNTTLNGSIYKAGSFDFGNLTLVDSLTTITATATTGGNITTGKVDGDGTGSQALALSATHGTVSLGDVGDNSAATVSDVNDNNATTTLTGTSYKAGSFELGATTLATTNSSHLTTITATGANGITLASVSGDSTNTAEALTLNAGTVSLGSVGNNNELVGAVTDDQNGNLTTLTGSVYKASSFLFGNLSLGNNSNIGITATGGNLTAGTIEGTVSGQNLTLSATGTVLVNNIGDTGASLGSINDGSKTTLAGSTYTGGSVTFGNLVLDYDTTITASSGNIALGTVDGSTVAGQSLTLKAHGTASLGDVGDNGAATVTDVNDNSVNANAATTLNGSKYKAGSFEFGATTLASGTDATSITATGANGITLASVGGNSNRNSQALTLNASSVSLGNVGGGSNLVGAVTDNQNGNLTTLTGSQYTASSFAFGNLVLDNNTTITATGFSGGNITTGTVDGSGTGSQSLTLNDSNGTVSLGDVGDNGAATVSDVDDNDATTTLTGTSYKAGSFELGGTTLTNSAHLTTITATGANGITLDSVSGNSTSNANAQSLTLNAGAVSLGNVGNNNDVVGTVTDDQNGNLTTLTGTVYKALNFLFGNLLLGNNSNIAVTATGGNITAGTVEGTRTGQNLTLSASGTVSVNNIGDTGSSLGTVTDTSNTTLNGSIYKAGSFDFGNLTLVDSLTTITAIATSGGNITTGKVDGDGTGSQALALSATHGTVSLGDVGDNSAATVSDVNDNNATTTLTGSKYNAGSFELGATTLQGGNTTVTATGANGITLASVSGDSTHTAEALTLNAGTVSLGSVGNNNELVGAVTDDQNGNLTTLTGSVYKASSFLFGNLSLGNNSNIGITATGGNLTAGTIEGTVSGQNLTLSATGTVLVNNIGDTGASLGSINDGSKTTLAGSTYTGGSVTFGNLVLDYDTTITASSGNIALGTVDGSTVAGQSLTLKAHGTASLGDVGDNGAATVTDVNDNSVNANAATTLNGSKYKAGSFEFGATTLASFNDNTSITATGANGITLASVSGNSNRNSQALTLNASSVSLGDVGDGSNLVGSVSDNQNGNLTTLTGSSYTASSFAFGNLVLDNNTTITATGFSGGNISTGTVEGSGVNGGQNLTLSASNGTVTLKNVGDTTVLGTVIDTNNRGTTLAGSSYDAASFAFGNLVLDNNTTITATGALGITTGKVDGSTLAGQSLTLKASTVSLGDVGDNTGATVTDVNDNSVNPNAATTLTGSKYKAGSFEFGATTLATTTKTNNAYLTTITATGVNGITLASVSGNSTSNTQALTLNASSVSLGDVGDGSNLVGAVIDDQNGSSTTLTSGSYTAASFDMGPLFLSTGTTFNTSADNGSITLASVDNATGTNSLTLVSGSGLASIGNVGQNTTALGAVQDISSGGVALTGSLYTAASFDFGATMIDQATTLDTSAAGGDVTLASLDGTGTGGQDLTVKTGTGWFWVDGDIGDNAAPGTIDTTAVGGGTYLSGSSNLAGGFNLGATYLFATDVTLDTSAADTGLASDGNITAASVDNYLDGPADLTLIAGTGSVSLGDVGDAGALNSVVDTSNQSTTLTGGSYDAASFGFGAVLLGAGVDATVNATGNVTIASVDGNTAGTEDLSIDAGSISLGDVGVNTVLGELNLEASPITLTGDTYNADDLFTTGNIVLTAANTTVTADGIAALENVDGTTAGAQSLTVVNPGFTLLGDTGANVALGSVTSSGGTVLAGDTYNANNFTFGAVELDPLVPGAGTTVTVNTSADNGQITMASVDAGPFLTSEALVLNAGSGSVSLGNVGASQSLASLTDTSNTTLTGGTYNAGSLTFGALTLDTNTTLNTKSDNGAVTVASVDGSTAGGQNLTITAGTGSVLLGNAGASTRLGAVSDTSSTTLTGGTYNANSLTFGALTLDTNTTLNTSADNGALTVASVNGSTVGGQSLTLNSGSGTTSLGNSGASTRLGALSDSGPTTLTGSTYDANSFTFGGNVTLTAANTTLNSTQSASAAGDITFNANILGTSNGGQSLVLIAGPGTGAASANGNLTWQNAGTTSLELDNMTVSGNNLTALTAELAGNFTSTLTGNQSFANNTLNVGGNILSNASGDITGHMVAVGDVTLNAGGNITGTINGYNIDITAASLTNSDLTAVNDINVVAGILLNDIFSAGNTVSIIANSINSTTVTATTFDVSALTGSVNGTWTNLNATTGLDLRVNGELASFEAFNGQELVVEGFTLPNGTQIGANGALILPQGILIGLLSPGGGQPQVVLVHSVQELGELLSEGYVAIVIDLDGRKKDDDNMQVASN